MSACAQIGGPGQGDGDACGVRVIDPADAGDNGADVGQRIAIGDGNGIGGYGDLRPVDDEQLRAAAGVVAHAGDQDLIAILVGVGIGGIGNRVVHILRQGLTPVGHGDIGGLFPGIVGGLINGHIHIWAGDVLGGNSYHKGSDTVIIAGCLHRNHIDTHIDERSICGHKLHRNAVVVAVKQLIVSVRQIHQRAAAVVPLDDEAGRQVVLSIVLHFNVALADDQHPIALVLRIEDEYGAALAAVVVALAGGGDDIHARLVDADYLLRLAVLVVPLVGQLIVLILREYGPIRRHRDGHAGQVVAVGGAGGIDGHLQIGGFCDDGEGRRGCPDVVALAGDGHAGGAVPHVNAVGIGHILEVGALMQHQLAIVDGDLGCNRLPGVILGRDGLNHAVLQVLGHNGELLGGSGLARVVANAGYGDGVAARIHAVPVIGHGEVLAHDQRSIAESHSHRGVLLTAVIGLAVVRHGDRCAAQVGLLNGIGGGGGLAQVAVLAPEGHSVGVRLGGNFVDSDHAGLPVKVGHVVIVRSQRSALIILDRPGQICRDSGVDGGLLLGLHGEGVLGPAGVVGHAGIPDGGLVVFESNKTAAGLRVVPALKGVAILLHQRYGDHGAGSTGDGGRDIVGDFAAVEHEADGDIAHPDSGKGHIAVDDQLLDLIRGHGLAVQAADPAGGGGPVLAGGGNFR